MMNEDIICISSIDWDFVWQGHQEIMTRLARNGNKVLFIENTGVRTPRIRDFRRIIRRIANWKKGIYGIRKIEDRLYVYSPIVFPFPYLKIARFINKKMILSALSKWLKAVGFSDPIVWAFLPTGLTLDIVDHIDPKILIYYCIDSFQASSADAKKIRDTEILLLRKADIVFVTSEELFKYCSRHNKKVHYFPFGVSIENFKKAFLATHSMPDDIKNIKRPIIGYIGGIHKWIDLELLSHAASKNKNWSFVFCGPIQTDITRLRNFPNVAFLGQKRTEELPAYVKEFDVAIIPYQITDYTRSVYPTKLNEYLYVGKRVVSTDLPEVRKFNAENGGIIRISATQSEFADNIKGAVDRPMSQEEIDFAKKTAEKNSWHNKIEQMSRLIKDVEREKARQKEISWKNNLRRLYKRAKKRVTSVVAASLIFYTVIFYTPLVWLAANPLKISQPPDKTDCIVVFGGGVGESGKAGQGYEERVQYAAELYKKGYADRLIFSSGYKYIFNETLLMKALGLMLDIPEDAIILEDKARNTYENVKFTGELLRREGWNKILLISSPYHMRRVSLVFNKADKNIRVIFTPLPNSSFYSYNSKGILNKRITLTQIKGIFHEYLGILYYWWRGII